MTVNDNDNNDDDDDDDNDDNDADKNAARKHWFHTRHPLMVNKKGGQ